MPEPTTLTPHSEKPAGVISFEEAAQFSRKPYPIPKRLWVYPLVISLLFVVATIIFALIPSILCLVFGVLAFVFVTYVSPKYLVRPLTSTKFGGIYVIGSTITTPITFPLYGIYQLKYPVPSKDGRRLLAQRISAHTEEWVKHVYYKYMMVQVKKDMETLPQPPVFYQTQVEWYEKYSDYYYNMLFEDTTTTPQTNTEQAHETT